MKARIIAISAFAVAAVAVVPVLIIALLSCAATSIYDTATEKFAELKSRYH